MMLKFFQNFGVCCAEVDYLGPEFAAIKGCWFRLQHVAQVDKGTARLRWITSLAHIDCTDRLKLLRF